MILGFVLGWCAATYWWPWVLSFYEPKPPPTTLTFKLDNSDGRFAPIRWRKDGGP